MEQSLKTQLNYKDKTPLLQKMGVPTKPRNNGMQLAVARTARHGNSARISYTKVNGQFRVYDVQRYSFRTHKGVKFLYRYDIKDNGIKSFVAKNISNVLQIDIPHKKLWIVEMGNDPQQIKYWKKEMAKTPQERRKADALKDIQQYSDQINRQVRASVTDIKPEVRQQRAVIQQAAQSQAEPVVSTISRQQLPQLPQIPTIPTIPGSSNVFGVV